MWLVPPQHRFQLAMLLLTGLLAFYGAIRTAPSTIAVATPRRR